MMIERFVNLFDEHCKTITERYPDRVLAVCVYGSQNYDLATEKSDIDTKAFILPTLRELVQYKKVSETITADHTGGLCDAKHIDLMVENFLKGNINFLEVLYSPYLSVYGNEVMTNLFQDLLEMRESIVHSDVRKMLHAAAGMAEQKYVALKRPFEGKLEVLAKYGYDPKQLASMYRLQYFLDTWEKTEDFWTSIHPKGEMKEIILEMKKGVLTEEEAVKAADKCRGWIQRYMERVDQKYPRESDGYMARAMHARLHEWAYEVTKAAIQEELSW